MKRARHVKKTRHVLVQLLMQGNDSPVKRGILQHLDAASMWSLHVVAPEANLLQGHEPKRIFKDALTDISQGAAGPRPFALLRDIVASIPVLSKEGVKQYVTIAINSMWTETDADFETFLATLCIRHKIAMFNVIRAALRPDIPFRVRKWADAKGTIEFICKYFKTRLHDKNSVSDYLSEVVIRRMQKQCDFQEMHYILSMAGESETIIHIPIRYMDAISYHNYNLALEIWKQLNIHSRNELREIRMNEWVYSTFSNHRLVWQEPLQTFTSMFAHDACQLYDFLEHVIREHGAPDNLYASIIYNLTNCTGKRDAAREYAIVLAIIEKMSASEHVYYDVQHSTIAAAAQMYMPFFHIAQKQYPMLIRYMIPFLHTQLYELSAKEHIFSDQVAAKICATWTELRQLFPAFQLPLVNARLRIQ